MEELYFREDYLCLYIDKNTRTVRAVWNGFLNGDTLRQAVNQCLQLITEQQPHFWLADNRKMKAIRQKDQEWLESVIIPKLMVSPLQKMATMVSEDIFNQMAVDNLHRKANNHVKFDHQYFKNEKAAAQWLEEKHSLKSQWQ